MLNSTENVWRPRMPELDSLRGVAILLVLFYHGFGWEYGLQGLSGLERRFVAATLTGWTGVDLFFVLSGFLITGILLDTKPRPDYYRRFYIRRALRILPLYFAVLLFLAIATRTPLFPHAVPWSFLGISMLFLTNFATVFKIPVPYGPFWSLAVEEHFYLLWPAVVRKLSARRVALGALAVCMVCPALRAVSFLLHRGRGWTEYGGYTWFVADSLATGALFAVAVRSSLNSRRTNWKLAAAALATGTGIAIVGAPFGILCRERLLGMALRQTALNIFFLGVLVLTLLIGTGRWKRFACFKPLRFLGEISYGVYLIHTLVFWIVDRFVEIALPKSLPLTGHFFGMTARFCGSVIITIAISYVSRWYFEEYFLRLKDKLS